MRLKAYINGKEYDIVQGATFTEEYNETLDSAVITIADTPKMDIEPYDDVFIYDGDLYETFPGVSPANLDQLVGIESMIGATANDIWERPCDPQDAESSPIIYGISISYIESLEGISDIIRGQIFLNCYEGQAMAEYVCTEMTSSRVVFTLSSGTAFQGHTTLTYTTEQGGFLTLDQTISDNNLYGVETRLIYGEASLREFGVTESKPSGFYRHLLVDQYIEEVTNIEKRLYKTKIQLFSETKGLECVQLPNISVTNPLNPARRRTAWQYLNHLVDFYSPTKKFAFGDRNWQAVRKYQLDPSLEDEFGEAYVPDMALDKPSLKDAIAQIMLTKDMIPSVKDWIITGIKISETHGYFRPAESEIDSITGSMSSNNYANSLKRAHTNALSQESTCRRVEYLGFRNSDSALMTLSNMRLEFTYPIYRINKMLMCYYKKVIIKDSGNNDVGERYFLCKQDITPLIMLNAKRNVLSQDWTDFNNTAPTSIEQMAAYRLCTLGYDIGSREISGWGETYSYPVGWWNVTKSYLENIFDIADSLNAYGQYSDAFMNMMDQVGEGQTAVIQAGAVTPFSLPNASAWMKGLVFEVEYEAFFNGAIVTDKNDGKDMAEMRDNQSSSLTVLEKDGLFQKEKIERFGNKALVIECRHDSPDDTAELGSVFDYDGEGIIYRKEYSVYSNFTKARYMATKDYVLRNYFTSVYSQHRPYNMTPYEQSVTRAENRRMMVRLGKDALYRIPDDGFTLPSMRAILSAFTPNPKAKAVSYKIIPSKIDYATIRKGSRDYSTDANIFTSGHSLCANVRMYDNIGMGNWIEDPNPISLPQLSPTEDAYTGSLQGWYQLVDDTQTDFITGTISFSAYASEKGSDPFSQILTSRADVITQYDRLFALPRTPSTEKTEEMAYVFRNVMKDNKETLDITIQLEYMAGEGVFITEWLAKLCDLSGIYWKNAEDYDTIDDTSTYTTMMYATLGIKTGDEYSNVTQIKGNWPLLILDFDSAWYGANKAVLIGKKIGNDLEWETPWDGAAVALDSFGIAYGTRMPIYMRLSDITITEATDDHLRISCTRTLRLAIRLPFALTYEEETEAWEYEFPLTSSLYVDNYGSYGINNVAVPQQGRMWFTSTSNGDIYARSVFFDLAPNALTYLNGTTEIGPGKISPTYNIAVNKQNEVNASLREVSITGGTYVTQHESRNMYVEYSSEEMTEYNLVKEKTTLGTTESIERIVASDQGLTIDLSNAPEGTKSVSYWFKSGAYRLVFATNVTEEDIERGYINVWASLMATKDRRVFGGDSLETGEVADATEDLANITHRVYNKTE